MTSMPTMTMLIDPNPQKEFRQVLEDLGLTLSRAVIILLEKVAREQLAIRDREGLLL